MTSNDPDLKTPAAVNPVVTAVHPAADADAGWPDGDADWPDGVSPILDQAFDAGTLYALRAAVQAHATRLGMPEARTDDLVIAVHELAANAVRHGAGDGRLRMWERAGALHCQVRDAGDVPPSDDQPSGDQPPGGAPPDGLPAGNAADGWPFVPGHGLWLARLVGEEISVMSGPDGTRATVVFALPDAARLCLRPWECCRCW